MDLCVCGVWVCVCFYVKDPRSPSGSTHLVQAALHSPPLPSTLSLWCNWSFFFLHDGPTFSVCSGIQGFFQSNVLFIILSETLHIRFPSFLPAYWSVYINTKKSFDQMMVRILDMLDDV